MIHLLAQENVIRADEWLWLNHPNSDYNYKVMPETYSFGLKKRNDNYAIWVHFSLFTLHIGETDVEPTLKIVLLVISEMCTEFSINFSGRYRSPLTQITEALLKSYKNLLIFYNNANNGL